MASSSVSETPDRVAKLRAAVLASLPKEPPRMPATFHVRVKELDCGEFAVTVKKDV